MVWIELSLHERRKVMVNLLWLNKSTLFSPNRCRVFAACDLKRQTSVLSAYGLELDRRRTDALISATLQRYTEISASTSTESVSDSTQSCAVSGSKMVKQLNGGLTLNSLYMLTGVVSRQFTHAVDLYIVKHSITALLKMWRNKIDAAFLSDLSILSPFDVSNRMKNQ